MCPWSAKNNRTAEEVWTNIEIWDEVSALIDSQQVERGIEIIEERLKKCETSHFKSIIGVEIKNNQIDVARDINGFIRFCEDTFDIDFIQKISQNSLIEKQIPILVSAHDFDIIAKFNTTE
jgi:hypothetical protein